MTGSLPFALTTLLTLIVVGITLYYARQTRIEVMMATRPLLVIRAVVHEPKTTYDPDVVSAPKGTQEPDGSSLASHFSHFEIFNAGNSPTIDLQILLLNAEKTVLQSETLGFLRNTEQALPFVPIRLDLNKTYYLVCEYESIRSRARKVWYQTWLQFTAVDSSAKNKISVNVGEMDFREVSITERINPDKVMVKSF